MFPVQANSLENMLKNIDKDFYCMSNTEPGFHFKISLLDISPTYL